MNERSKKKIVIVGAGYTGLSAAYHLTEAGHKVIIVEKDADIGGLAGTFELSPGIRIEKFYHHWFSSDTDILDFIEALGLKERISFFPTNTGLFFVNSIFRLASPLDLLRFTPLPFIDRIRTGLMALYARKINAWKTLENLSASQWIINLAGKNSYETIWKPLLHGKFGAEAENISAVWFWNKLKLRGSSRNKKGAEELAYFKGGFGALTDEMRKALEKKEVEFKLQREVKKIVSEDNRVVGVDTDEGFIAADAVLSTTPLPIFLKLAPDLPADLISKLSAIRFLGNVCLVLRLKQSLSDTYWLNVADPSFPFVGVIEHTNFDDPKNYNGERIAYISKYLPTSDPLYKLSESEFFEYSLPYIQKIFPAFNRDWIIGYKTWKAEYSQPIITKGYSELLPPETFALKNLYCSTMAHIYPEDRGTNYAVRYGKRIAKQMIQDLQ
jgi:protoporphyrinogen oxidase